jgi:glycosyltransferase involved in cell wall biosynthesis
MTRPSPGGQREVTGRSGQTSYNRTDDRPGRSGEACTGVRPSVSVIVPVRDGAAFLGEQLAALAGQQYGGRWEVLVADNGSTDGSADIARSFVARLPTLRVLDASARRGAGAARNIAAKSALGSVLAFCDADDVVASGWLDAHAEAAAGGGLVTGPVDLAALDPTIDPAWVAWMMNSPMRALGWLPFALGANLALRRDTFEALSGFDEEYLVGEDVDLSWRLQLAGHPFRWASGAVVAKRPRRGGVACWRHAVTWGRADLRLARKFSPCGLAWPQGIRGFVRDLGELAAAGWRAPLIAVPRYRRGTIERSGRAWGRVRERSGTAQR